MGDTVAIKKVSDVRLSASSFAYDGKAHVPDVVVNDSDGKPLGASSYTVSYSDSSSMAVGTYSATVTLKGDYSGKKTLAYEITEASASSKPTNTRIAEATITGVASKTYIGNAITQNPTVKLGSATLAKGVDYTLSYANNVNAGTATMTVTGKGSYTGTKQVTFVISPAPLSSATVTVADQAYTGSAISPEPIVTLAGKTLVAGTDYSVSYGGTVRDAGSYTATVTGKGNYTGTVSGSFKVVAANSPSVADATVTGVSDQAYTGKQIRPVPTVKLDGKTLSAGTDYTLSYGENVTGTGTVTIVGAGSYVGSKTVTFAIAGGSAPAEGDDEGDDEGDGADDPYDGDDEDDEDENEFDITDADV